MILRNLKGYVYAALAAAAYGTNPVFAIPLYEEGMDPNSVLLLRYLLGVPVMAFVMALRGVSFKIRKEELAPAAILGVLMAVSSLALFESYRYMNSGIASTLLFIYPILVAVMMIFFFHEKFKWSVALCLFVMTGGLILLMDPSGGDTLSLTGILLVGISALTYALYIIFINVSKTVKAIPTTKLLFYVLCWGSMLYILISIVNQPPALPHGSESWLRVSALALIPTVISLALTTRAIQIIGSTPTAILGALEPVSAVVLSVVVLGQSLSLRELGEDC